MKTLTEVRQTFIYVTDMPKNNILEHLWNWQHYDTGGRYLK